MEGFTYLETFNVGEGVVVRSLAVDEADNRLWVGTSLGALEVDLTTGAMINTWTRENALANEYVFAAFVDQQGNKWFGTNGGGVSVKQAEGDGWKTWFPLHGLADYWVYSFAQQAQGSVWIGTWAGLNAFDPATGKFRTFLKELVNEWVYGLDVDSLDRVWVGTEGGVNRYDGQQWQTWTHLDGLGAANEQGLPFSDNTGLGTRSRHDLSVMTSGKATYNPNYVFSLKVDADDRVWAGTWGGGVSRFDGKKWQNWTMKEGLPGNIVYSVTLDEADRPWVGTNAGISWYNGRRWQQSELNSKLPDQHVYALVTSAGGHVWVGTRGGVSHFKYNIE